MDPITVTAIWLLIGLTVVNLFRKPKALPALAPKAVNAPVVSSEHRLVKTWISQHGDSVLAGWRAKCSCGAIQYATNAKIRVSYGSESNAIEMFEKHAKNFTRVNGSVNPDKAEIERLNKELEDHKAACFCKEVSSVELLPLKG